MRSHNRCGSQQEPPCSAATSFVDKRVPQAISAGRTSTGRGGPTDQADVEKRADVRVFSSPPFEQPVE